MYKLGHLAFGVSDINKSLDFYCGIMEFKELFRMSNQEKNPSMLYLKVNTEQYIELFPADNVANIKEQSYKHLCLHVEDISSAVASIKAKGWPIDRDILQGRDGNFQAWITDPDGNRIEIMQLETDSLQRLNDK